ncbi:hypothetical protein TNCV_4066721 [Trichonephila clavipes]|uniref:Uncharacterized protein n=1 Tax=Trichonephila clavipes TaxID=2585209 RepID=A0A8X7BHD5_TRICX|nr:hypothetical protein TNCV_4066721 [Trichonephila clavipes]
MSLNRFLGQYEQLSQLERGRIIGMMAAGWLKRRVARQLGRSDCVVRRCTGSSFTGASVSSRTLRRHLSERHLAPITGVALDDHPLTPPFEVVPSMRKLDCSGMEPGRL